MASQPPPGGPGDNQQPSSLGSLEWAELIKQQFGDSFMDRQGEVEDSPLFKITSDGALLDELLKTLSGGEGLLEQTERLFSEKTLNALLGSQIQGFADAALAEAGQTAAAGAGTSAAGAPTAPNYAYLDAALQLLSQPGGPAAAAAAVAAAQPPQQQQPQQQQQQQQASGVLGHAFAPPQPQPPQQQQQQPQQQQFSTAVVEGQIVARDGTVLLPPLPQGQQLHMQVPGPDGSIQLIPVLDSRVISLPAQRQAEAAAAVQPTPEAGAGAGAGMGPGLAPTQQQEFLLRYAALAQQAQQLQQAQHAQQAQQQQQLQQQPSGGAIGRELSLGLSWLHPQQPQPQQQQQQQPTQPPAALPRAASAAAAAAAAGGTAGTTLFHPQPSFAFQPPLQSLPSLGVPAAQQAQQVQQLPRAASHPVLASAPASTAASPVSAAPGVQRSASHSALAPMLALPTSSASLPQGVPLAHTPSVSPAPPPVSGALATVLDPAMNHAAIAATQQLVAAAAVQQQVLQQSISRAASAAAPGVLEGGSLLPSGAVAAAGGGVEVLQPAPRRPQPTLPVAWHHSAPSSPVSQLHPQQQQQQQEQQYPYPFLRPGSQAVRQVGPLPPSQPVPIVHGGARGAGSSALGQHGAQQAQQQALSCPEGALAMLPATSAAGGLSTPRSHKSDFVDSYFQPTADPNLPPDTARSAAAGGGAGSGSYFTLGLQQQAQQGLGHQGASHLPAGLAPLALPSKPCHKRERSIRSANPEGIAPAAKAFRNLGELLSGRGGSGAGAGAGGAPSLDEVLEDVEYMSSLLEPEMSSAGTHSSSPYATVSGVQDQFMAIALARGGSGSGASSHRSEPQPQAAAAAAAALLIASPPVRGGTPGAGSAAAGAAVGRRGSGAARGARGGAKGAAAAAGRQPGAAAAGAGPAASAAAPAEDPEVEALIKEVLKPPPGKRRGRPPGRRNGTLPPEYEAELEEANILRELLMQDPSNRLLPVDELKKLMRKEKNKKMAAFSRTKNVLHVTQLEDKVRKLSEEGEWLRQQLTQGPAPDVPPHKLLLGTGEARPRQLVRHLSL